MTVMQAVQNSSQSAIREAMQRLSNDHFSGGRWLGLRNRYVRETIRRIREDSGNQQQTLVSKQLAEYLAASSVLHCLDGWSYLSHAVNSLLNGDYGSAVHLAYYSELRAAVSFLASEGIGAFNYRHCWIDSSGAGHIFRGDGTHRFVWEVMQKWADDPQKSQRLLSLFKIRGKTIGEWLEAAGYVSGSPPTTRLAGEWLGDWSLDLAVVAQDRDFRNDVSYRPQHIRAKFDQAAFAGDLKAIIEFWRMCEPSGTEKCSILDRYLLRHALESTHRMRTGQRRLGGAFRVSVQQTASDLGVSPGGLLMEFLLRKRATTNHLLLREAKKKGMDSHGNPRPLSIIARAMLLLRLSSGAVDDLLNSESVSCQDIAFWWQAVGQEIGLWDGDAEPDNITDLWADIQPVLDDVTNWYTTTESSISVIRSHQQRSFELWTLAQFQRVGLWAIGL